MMQKAKEFCSSKYFTWMLVALGTLGILIYYGKNIIHMNSVWELVDEYGYLANAAYLSGKDWGWFTNMYYGYGYSLLLVPVFWVAKTGMQVIKGAVLINTMCLIFSFWVQIALMSKVFHKWNKNVIIFIAFVISFYPYLISGNMKVTCECLLTFMIWLCGLLIYQAVTTEKWYYFAMAGVALAYTFFVHTRAFVFITAFCLFVMVMLLQKKIGWKNLLILVVFAGAFFALGYLLKNHIIDAIYSHELIPSKITQNVGETVQKVEQASKVKVGNTLSAKYVIKKLLLTLKRFKPIHMYSFICKSLYLFAGTAGMFHVGVYVTLKDFFVELKETKRIGAENALKMMYAIAACVMAFALTVNSPGHYDDASYFFYGRYYEYLLGPMIFIGLGYFAEKKVRIHEVIVLLLLLFVSFYFTHQMADYLETQEFYFDSNRIPAFAVIQGRIHYYRAVVRYSALMALLVIVSAVIMNRMKKVRAFVPLLLLGIYLLNGHVITGTIIDMHGQDNHYYAIATYLHTNCDQDEIYFVNSDKIVTTAYTGIQSLLIDQKLTVVDSSYLEAIESGEWFVTFKYNPFIEESDKAITKVTGTEWFSIYCVE